MPTACDVTSVWRRISQLAYCLCDVTSLWRRISQQAYCLCDVISLWRRVSQQAYCLVTSLHCGDVSVGLCDVTSLCQSV